MIKYSYSAKNIQPEQIEGFCVDWQDRLSPKMHLKLLQNSDEIVLAIDEETGKVVGFITAITDKIISAIPTSNETKPVERSKIVSQGVITSILNPKGFYFLWHFYPSLWMLKLVKCLGKC